MRKIHNSRLFTPFTAKRIFAALLPLIHPVLRFTVCRMYNSLNRIWNLSEVLKKHLVRKKSVLLWEKKLVQSFCKGFIPHILTAFGTIICWNTAGQSLILLCRLVLRLKNVPPVMKKAFIPCKSSMSLWKFFRRERNTILQGAGWGCRNLLKSRLCLRFLRMNVLLQKPERMLSAQILRR